MIRWLASATLGFGAAGRSDKVISPLTSEVAVRERARVTLEIRGLDRPHRRRLKRVREGAAVSRANCGVALSRTLSRMSDYTAYR